MTDDVFIAVLEPTTATTEEQYAEEAFKRARRCGLRPTGHFDLRRYDKRWPLVLVDVEVEPFFTGGHVLHGGTPHDAIPATSFPRLVTSGKRRTHGGIGAGERS